MESTKDINPWVYDYSGDTGTGMITPISASGVDENELNSAISTAVDKLVNGAPEALDTLGEIAEALENSEDIEAVLMREIGKKLDTDTYEEEKENFVKKDEMPTVPTKVSELENDLDFVTDSAVDEKIANAVNGYATEEWVENQHYLTEHQDISNLATKAEVDAVEESIPTKVSELENDANYLTEHQSLEEYAKIEDVYTKDEADAKFLTEHQDISNLATKAEVETVENKIPTKVSELTNDADFISESAVDDKIEQATEGVATEDWVESKNYLTEHQDLSAYVNGGAYNTDSKKIELLHDDNVVAEIDATDFIKDGMVESVVVENGNLVITFNTASGKEPITIPLASIFDSENYYTKAETDAKLAEKANIADLATVATSGSYNDLEDTPVIPEVPTNVSAFTNDAGYLTEHQSLEDYATKTEVAEADNAVKTAVFSKIWSNPSNVESGYFQTKYTNAKGNVAQLWNESDGGGALFENKVAGLKSFVGVNEDTENGVCVQIYSKHTNDNTGARLNVNPNGMFYGVGSSASMQPEEELAVKGDITNAVSGLAKESDIPTKVSELENDANYLTEHQSLAEYVKAADLATVATSGSYNDLEDKPVIPVVPTNVSAFNNDAGYLTEHQDLSAYFNGVAYNSDAKEIEFKHDTTVLATVDATPFIKDGMVYNVAIADGNLVITFNTDAGKEPIAIPLTDIFNPSNYYTKAETDGTFATKAESESGDNAVKTAVFSKIWSNPSNVESGYFQTKYTNANGNVAQLWNESDGGGALYENKVAGLKSFVGVNADGENGVCVQIYSKHTNDNTGARLNVNPNGMFYGVGSSASMLPEQELAVKGDVAAAVSGLASESDIPTKVSELENDANYLTEHQSLADYATKTEMTDADNAVKTAVFSKIWSKPNDVEHGYFQTKYTNSDGSVAQLWNESDGGGALYENKTAGIKSFVGVNADDENGVCVQIYSKHTANNTGARLNVNPNGMFYGVGSSASTDAGTELAVKNDIAADRAEVDALLAEKDATIAAMKDEVYALKQVVGNIGGAVTYDMPGEGKTLTTLLSNNGTVKLSDDVESGRYGPGMFAKNTTTLSLNGHKLIMNPTSDYASILARGTQNITIKGSGANSKIINEINNKIVWVSSETATVNIESGNFIGTSTEGSELIYCEKGTINITGGTFRTNCEDKRYLLNCYDANFAAGTANIIVSSASKTSGPKFYDFDPSNNPEGEGTTYVADGCHVTSSVVIEEGVEYTVYMVVKDA